MEDKPQTFKTVFSGLDTAAWFGMAWGDQTGTEYGIRNFSLACRPDKKIAFEPKKKEWQPQKPLQYLAKKTISIIFFCKFYTITILTLC